MNEMIIIVIAIFFFGIGYLTKDFLFFLQSQKMSEQQKGTSETNFPNYGQNPIFMRFDLNDGGYRMEVLFHNGIHLTKHNHEKFVSALSFYIEEQKKILKRKPDFQLLNFKRDE